MQEVLILDISYDVLLAIAGKANEAGRRSGELDALNFKSDDAADSSSAVRGGDSREDMAMGPRLRVGGTCGVWMGPKRAEEGGEGRWEIGPMR